MATVNYPRFVNKEGIVEDGDKDYRYSLYIPFECENSNNKKIQNKLVVILKNPSKATCNVSDITVTKVCNVAYNNGYQAVTILNLFPIRSTNPHGVLNFYKDPNFGTYMYKNMKYIQTECKKRDVGKL